MTETGSAPQGTIAPADPPPPPTTTEGISREELQLAARNHGMPLEAMRWPITPVGLHYLLIHYDIPAVDPGTWRLEVTGGVRHPLSLTLDEIRQRPAVTHAITFECAGNGRVYLEPRPAGQPWITEAIGTAEWTGTPLAPLLREAGLQDDAVEVVFTGLDRGVEGGEEQAFERSLSLDDALGDDVLLAYQVNGQPLPPQHGFPLRLVVPGWYGMTNVKWLRRITAIAEPFQGYQQATRYRFRQEEGEPGTPVNRMMPRALMVPPGVPELMSRRRVVPPGPVPLEGRAWSGHGPIEQVEVSVDGGGTWAPARLDEPIGAMAWRGWTHRWDPPAPGDYVLCARAEDAAGNRQPDEPSWNLSGYANNAIQRVEVTVTG